MSIGNLTLTFRVSSRAVRTSKDLIVVPYLNTHPPPSFLSHIPGFCLNSTFVISLFIIIKWHNKDRKKVKGACI